MATRKSCLVDLGQRLVTSLQQSAWTSAYRRYIPRAALNNLTSRECILSVVEEDETIEPSKMEEFSELLYKNSRVLFAMFVYFRLPIALLREIPYTDDDLPIPPNQKINIADKYDMLVQFETSIPSGQWMFLSPKISLGGRHQELDPNEILPFKSMDYVGAGTFGTVYKVEIEASHLTAGIEQTLALKRIYRRKNTDGMNERKRLEGLRDVGHPHIIELLASFELEQELCMFFPLATCDLNNYMHEERLLVDSEYSSWLVTQLRGLTDAISTIREYGITSTMSKSSNKRYHHDLKPENILFFQGSGMSKLQGVFKICDFGGGEAGTPMYAPPEAGKEAILSDQSEMWSLGCTILELLVWIRSGPEVRVNLVAGIEKFFKGRGENFDLHDEVSSAIKTLQNSENGPGLYKILEAVINGLLVVDPQARWTPARLLSHLDTIEGKGEL
ncbi:kinase-like domain-containing protein [Nemania sp. FL0031]|nr:kinase-like domain-containing protein [Nemania sp. FL0031]